MTAKETEIILDAIKKCQENIEKSFDTMIEDLKTLPINKEDNG